MEAPGDISDISVTFVSSHHLQVFNEQQVILVNHVIQVYCWKEDLNNQDAFPIKRAISSLYWLEHNHFFKPVTATTAGWNLLRIFCP